MLITDMVNNRLINDMYNTNHYAALWLLYRDAEFSISTDLPMYGYIKGKHLEDYEIRGGSTGIPENEYCIKNIKRVYYELVS